MLRRPIEITALTGQVDSRPLSGRMHLWRYIFLRCLSQVTRSLSNQYDGKEFKGVAVLTEMHTSGNKVRVKSGDFILNVDEKQVAKE